MNRRFPLRSVFEVPTKTNIRRDFKHEDAKWLLISVVAGALLMLACLYVVLILGWSKHIITFVGPLGIAGPCIVRMWTVTRNDGETGRARVGSLAMGAAFGYIGGQVQMAICVLAWTIVR